MILELLNHHQDLLLGALSPLIWRRDHASLGALGASCRRMRDFLADKVPFLAHWRKFRLTLCAVKESKILFNKYITLRKINDCIHVYSSYEDNRYKYSIYSTRMHMPHYIYNLNDYKGIELCHCGDKIELTTYGVSCTVTFYVIGNAPSWIMGSKNIKINPIILPVDRSYVFNIE